MSKKEYERKNENKSRRMERNETNIKYCKQHEINNAKIIPRPPPRK